MNGPVDLTDETNSQITNWRFLKNKCLKKMKLCVIITTALVWLSLKLKANQKSARTTIPKFFQLTILIMAQLFGIANGECSAHEIVTFAPCTSIPKQYYIVGASQASATNTFTVTSDGY